MKILLAEDDPNISTIAKMALESLGGHEVILVTDGEMALNAALKDQFDVILLDEMMPKMNGLSVCRAFREQSTSKVPIIFLSAKSQESDIQEFRGAAQGFIPKPFDPMQLSPLIDDILGRATA